MQWIFFEAQKEGLGVGLTAISLECASKAPEIIGLLLTDAHQSTFAVQAEFVGRYRPRAVVDRELPRLKLPVKLRYRRILTACRKIYIDLALCIYFRQCRDPLF